MSRPTPRDNPVPDPHRSAETALLLVSFLSLLHALRAGRGRIWASFLAFGLVMEVIGYVADTHTHAQFRWQIFSFLPLKELLWYPLTLYCSWCSARSAAFTDWWASAAAMALLQQTFACPYDFMGGRPAFGYWRFNKDFPLANFFDQSAAGHAPEGNPLDIHGLIQVTMCASWYAWLCMGFAAGAALHLYVDPPPPPQTTTTAKTAKTAKTATPRATLQQRQVGTLRAALIMGLAGASSGLLWAPFHVLKASTCAAMGGPRHLLATSNLGKRYINGDSSVGHLILPPLPPSVSSSSPASNSSSASSPSLWLRYLQCVRLAPATDVVCWTIGLLWLAAVVAIAVESSQRSGRNARPQPRHYGDSELVVIVVAYHMIILGLFLVYDKGAVHVILPLGLVAASALVIHGCFHFLAPGVWEQEAVGESRLKVE